MKNCFIIHGSFGDANEQWLPWLESELERGGVRVYNLDYPTGIDRQNYNNWEIVLDSVRRYITPDSVFICRSISCIFLVKYCIKHNLKIGKAIMMSGFNQMLGLNEEYDYVNCTMYTNRIEEFKNLCKERICYYSENDPYVPLNKLKEFIIKIDAKPILVKNAGHFNTDSGYAQFEELLKLI